MAWRQIVGNGDNDLCMRVVERDGVWNFCMWRDDAIFAIPCASRLEAMDVFGKFCKLFKIPIDGVNGKYDDPVLIKAVNDAIGDLEL